MATTRLSRRLGGAPLLFLAMASVLLALGCGAFSLPPTSKATLVPGSAEKDWERSAEEIHGLPVRGENIGVEEGKHVPPFSLKLVDGTVLTSADLLDTSQPTFLFFWATT